MGLISTTIPNLIGGVSQQPYTIRTASQCEAMENCYPSVVEFLRRRPASKNIARIIDKKVEDAAIHVINRDAEEKYVVVATSNDLKIFDLQGRAKTVNFSAGKSYLKTSKPNTDIAFLTINDYTFILNKTKVTQKSNNITTTRSPEALVFIKQASYSTDYTITLDGTSVLHKTFKDDNRSYWGQAYKVTSDTSQGELDYHDAHRYRLSSSIIATDLANKINALGPYTCTCVKSTLWIRKKDNSAFDTKVSDSRSNTHMSITADKVQRFSDLPLVAPKGFTTEIVGDESSNFDNYYVQFEADRNADFDTGVWKETVKPGISKGFDVTTMPHGLVREADGTFTFKTLDWEERKKGDLDSAPDPTFLGKKLSSIFFYRNRLGFLSNENCILSEAGKFFNFFPTTVTTSVDSDPIDVAAGDIAAVTLHHAASFSEGLILFSEKTQFVLEHDDVLSFKTTAIKPITHFECSTSVQPIGAGKNIFFATNRGDFAGVREYFVEENTSLTDAMDVTSHVPHYIKGKIQKMICSTNEDCLFCISSENRNELILYKYFWNGREKLQGSWSKWLFSGNIFSGAFIGSLLLLIVQYEDGLYLESMNIEPGYTDPESPFEFALDRKISETQITSIKYDEKLQQSLIVFPYALSDKPSIVSRYFSKNEHSALPAGVSFEVISYEGNAVRVLGDIRQVLFYAGIPYNSRFVFSQQILREDSGNNGKLAVTEGRLQLRNFTLTYGNTGYFEVHVTPEYRSTDIRKFTGRIVGHGGNVLGVPAISSGTFRFPVLSKADAVKIELISRSFLPYQITSAGWEGYYHIRSRRA